jgi:hypothetical protein
VLVFALLCGAAIYYFIFLREGGQMEAFKAHSDVEISL